MASEFAHWASDGWIDISRPLHPQIPVWPGDRPFKLVANLPYQVASPLMAALLLDHPHCTGQFVTIQKEVADRLLAGPGSKAYGPLGIIIQALGEVRKIAAVKPASFWPQPKVTSAMVSITPKLDHGIMQRIDNILGNRPEPEPDLRL